jgi:exonuclease VII large subunit
MNLMPEQQLTNIEISEFQNVYSPRTLLGVYSNALRTTADGRVIIAKGIFQLAQNQREYSGFYYDILKSLNGNESIKIKVPSLLRIKLDNNSVYLFKGYVEKKINFSAIELVLVIDDVLQKEENQVSEEEIKRFELLQKKIAKGYRDLEAVVKENIYKGNVIKIVNIYGNTAIVHKDFEKGLAEAIIKFKVTEYRCNFSSKIELTAAIQKLKLLDYDIIAIVRGGGDKASFEIFNDSELGNEATSLKQILVTALGHTATEETLMDKVADKKFALPFDYGNTLKVWVDQAIEEQAKSKSIFIEQVKNDLSKTYTEQIISVQKQLEVRNKEFEIAQIKFKEIIDQNQKDKTDLITAAQKQLEVRNKEFETTQIKFKELIEQNQKDKLETIQAKEIAFNANLKILSEQIKAKDETIKIIQINNESTEKQRIQLALAEYKTRYEIINSERDSLARQLDSITKTKNNLIIYIIVALVIGLLVGLML